jgi:DNA-binding transcriptional ArsR family regulator
MSQLYEMEEVEWDEISFVISSRYRVAVLERLVESPATPSQIASESSLPISHVSRALQELRDRSLVELLVSEDRKKGRVYGITIDAEQVWESINQGNLA